MTGRLDRWVSALTASLLVGGGLGVALTGDDLLPGLLGVFAVAFLLRAGVAFRAADFRRAVGDGLATGGWLVLWSGTTGWNRWLGVGLLGVGGLVALGAGLNFDPPSDRSEAR